jgi:integrase
VTNELGEMSDPNNFSRWRRDFFADNGLGYFEHEEIYTDPNGVRHVKRSGYKGYNFHELRHTQATLLIGSGADIKTVQHRLGHSSASLTMNIYAHAIAANDRTAADTIGSTVFASADTDKKGKKK